MDENSDSTLFCEENPSSLDEQEAANQHTFNTTNDDDDDDEYVQMLLDTEISSAEKQHSSSQVITTNWFKEARNDAVQYILNIRAFFGFKCHTAYLSMLYLDKFLSRTHICGEKHWAIRLLSMACIHLAAKMEEYQVPALSDLPMKDYDFESRVIHKMELLVLSTLDWRMTLITPFTFVDYFVSRFCGDSTTKNLKSRIFEVILGAVKDVNLMSYRPSGISAAATLITLDPRLSREALQLRLNVSSSSRNLNIEDVWPCFIKLQELNMETQESSKNMVSSPLSPIQLQNVKAMEKSSSTHAIIGSKRKRLEFNENRNEKPQKETFSDKEIH